MCLLLVACQQQALQSEQPLTHQAQLKNIETIIDLECQQDSQCQSIGIRPMACGGFAEYLIYSQWKTPEPALKQAVSQFNQDLQQVKNTAKGSSICLHIAKPRLECIQQVCRAQSSQDPR